MYQRKVNVDMLNAVKSVLADVSSVSPSSEQKSMSFLDKSLLLLLFSSGTKQSTGPSLDTYIKSFFTTEQKFHLPSQQACSIT